METFDSGEFCEIVNTADMVVPDGKPLVWAQKLMGHKEACQVRGQDLTMALCKLAIEKKLKVGFYGGTQEVLSVMKMKLSEQFSGLDIAYEFAPPFRPLTSIEDKKAIKAINDSGVQILFVGIGCPKQERWMAEHKNKLHCVMLGVGAAFDFIAGNKKHAPRWMQSIGMEWLFRLLCEPNRLWKRYLKQNPRFIWYFAQQLLGSKFKSRE
ncbi:WecB/TagA/CpsF family glycosyltransferase [Kistimonas scapharcae]